jgi:hypothetical protein
VKRIPPALVLYFLAPALGELLSGSAPPAEFFNPLSLLILTALYGGGALLVRERTLRWGKRWPTILVLGLAYGILEEGLMVKSFFDPAWPDLGTLGVYGRWAGVNWVWSLGLTIYHAVFSIAISIFLVELMFPERRDDRWLGRRGLIGISLLLLVDVLFGAFVLTTYWPTAMTYILTFVVMLALYVLARKMPLNWFEPSNGSVRRPLIFGLLGFFGTTGMFVQSGILSESEIPAVVTMLSMTATMVLIYFILRRISGDGAWTDEHRLALTSGALLFFVLLAPLQELDTTRLDNPSGMTLVALVALVILVWLSRKVRRSLSVQEVAPTTIQSEAIPLSRSDAES